ncbi:MAG: hypothetical protein RBR13_07270 [Tenuifilaceae bacterium]|nr:hypothetical protein [Tenuifilaceae bacterium]
MKSSFFRSVLFLFLFLTIGVTAQLRAQNQSDPVTQENSQNTELTKEKSKENKGVDWFEMIILVGYFGGVLVLLPIVIYINRKEKLFVPNSSNQNQISIIEDLTEEQRNQKAKEILEQIDTRLTSFKGDDGSDRITITKGSQAKFMKFGLDYINKKLSPTDQTLVERINEFSNVYNDRTKRAFTGSNWVIGCSVALAILFFFTGGISAFLFIHLLGLVFYFLSSRTTFYGIEKRMKYFGGGSGLIGGLMTGLFLGNGVKYYIKESSGSRKRDWETEGQMALMGIVLLLIAAMVLGFFTAFLGVINFVINYSNSLTLPFKTEEKWYDENFPQ